ncbi:MAG TPA: glutamate 5-kinase [Actinobacteria bacterium]|nr:glutamate 5-kinase [Actinomycetota bacterium]
MSSDRGFVTSAKRIVVKIGSSSITSAQGGLNVAAVQDLVQALVSVRQSGTEVVLVSSGAIAAGLAPLGLSERPKDLATQQAAASVGQGLLVHRYTDAFAEAGFTVGQVLLTVDDVGRRAHYKNAQRTLNRLLEVGAIPVVNENDTVATDEIRFGDNDRLAALVAHLVQADALILLSDVDGLYDADPSTPGAQLISDVVDAAGLDSVELGGVGSRGVGSGGMVTKVEAARLATSAGIPVVLASAVKVKEVLAGSTDGTYFHASGQRRATRLLWLAHATDARGQLILDAGAVNAIVNSGSSLLPAGVTGVVGEFEAGDPVELVTANGEVIARGLVAYDAHEIPALLGRSIAEIATELGEGYGRELVHRDDLVLLSD